MLVMHFDDHPCYEICNGKTYSAEVMHKPSRDRDRKFDFTVQPPICTALYEYNRPRAGQRCENSFALAISHAKFGWPLFLIDGKKMPQPGRGSPQNPIKTRA